MAAWNEGGKAEWLGNHNMSMTHDELVAKLGPVYEDIKHAGFQLCPIWWFNQFLNKANEDATKKFAHSVSLIDTNTQQVREVG